ncbi:MAG: hypothetical protein O2800_02415 [Planctomycetota bacterium]|nr:hypothetical protein [Planctomycetota bacterium]
MSQLALGLRNLAFRLAIFIALAAAFAWMVGGQLFPGWRTVRLDSTLSKTAEWNLAVDGHASRPSEGRWFLERRTTADRDANPERIDLIPSVCTFAIGPFLIDETIQVWARESTQHGPIWWRVDVSEDGSIVRTRMEGIIGSVGSSLKPAADG